MAETRVFISSTCYDLSLLRSQLRIFIKNMGYEPIMSDYEDILYDPRIHTHTSCVDEVQNCDILVLIIGSRFGGKASPEALNRINFDVLNNETLSVDVDFEMEWDSFKQLQPKVKEIVLDTLSEMYRPTSLIRYRSMHIEDYLHEYSAQISGRDE